MGEPCYCMHTNQTETNNTIQAPHIQVQKMLLNPDKNIYLNFRLRSKIAFTVLLKKKSKIDLQKKSVVITTSLWDKLSVMCALLLPSKSLLLLHLNFCDSYLTNTLKTHLAVHGKQLYKRYILLHFDSTTRTHCHFAEHCLQKVKTSYILSYGFVFCFFPKERSHSRSSWTNRS